MARVLITNGDHAAHALAAHFPDADILIWRDVLVEGPVPGGIDDEALADIRAEHIEQAFGMNDVRADFTRRNEALARIAPLDEVELWFETDLHDQLQILELLPRLASIDFANAPRLLLCPPPLSGHIGEAGRSARSLTLDDYQAAAALWPAFRAETPERLHAIAFDHGALPEARTSLQRLLEEYPSPRDGLGRIERNALLAIRDGAITPGLAFRHYQQTEALPFLGDLGFYYRLEQLAHGPAPLVSGLPQGGISTAARSNRTVEYIDTPIELTGTGNRVLDGNADQIALNGIDRWIGGVHLTPDNCWRYDPATKALARV
jgi:hypothetical protein